MEIMAEATNVIAEGEVLQLMNAHDPDTTEQRYLEVIYRKTATAVRGRRRSGRRARRRQRRACSRALAAYGKHLGTAYQLVDDVLDYHSDPGDARQEPRRRSRRRQTHAAAASTR